MHTANHTFKGEDFFQNSLPLYVNRAVENYDLPLHSHDFIELTFVAEGKGFHYMDQQVEQAGKGQLYFIPVGISHVFRPSSPGAHREPLVVYNCLFPPELLDSLSAITPDPAIAAYFGQIRNNRLTPFSVTDRNGSIESLFLSLHREYQLPQTGSGSFLLTLLIQLLVGIYRLGHDDVQFPLNKQTQFVQILDYIHREYAQEITLAHLSRSYDWSERHLQRLFKAHTGQTFHHYLQNVRIQQSCLLLTRQLLTPVQLIAEQVGYHDLKTFGQVFKRIIGITPGSYRKAHGKARLEEQAEV